MRDIVGGIADIYDGEVAEEKVHRAVEAVVQADEHKDECISHQSGRVEDREKDKERDTQDWIAGEPEEDEFCDSCLILHAVLKVQQHKPRLLRPGREGMRERKEKLEFLYECHVLSSSHCSFHLTSFPPFFTGRCIIL